VGTKLSDERREDRREDMVDGALVEEPGCRPMRADALRNRQRILEAAEEIFAREGISVPVDVVAERACVGVGTLYRHFPTKEALFEAIVLTKLNDLIEATEVEEHGDATEVFFEFLLKMADQVSLKHDIYDAMSAAGIDLKSRCSDTVQKLELGLDKLRQRAVESGGVRDDVSTQEVVGLVIGACLVAERPGMAKLSSRQMVGVVCDGLRANVAAARR
jgi:AcrR family transcriptional regulator